MADRYWLFAGFTHYPLGGMFDVVGTFPTEENAREVGERMVADEDESDLPLANWWQVLDSEEFRLAAMHPADMGGWPPCCGEKGDLLKEQNDAD